MPATLDQILLTLARDGLLMQADVRLPSLVTLVAGEPVRGSWWGHPMGDTIHVLGKAIRSHKDVIVAYLIAGKITFLHRKLWPALFGVAASGEPWQRKGLSRSARALLKLVEQSTRIRADRPKVRGRFAAVELRATIRELEARLLVHSTDTHTETGTHAKTLQTWQSCRAEKRFRGAALPVEKAREKLDTLLESWSKTYGVRPKVPWGRGSS